MTDSNPELEINWCNTIETRDGSLTTDAKMVNCYTEQTSNGSALVKRAGTAALYTFAPGTVGGQYTWNGDAFWIVNNLTYDKFATTPGDGNVIPNPPLLGSQYQAIHSMSSSFNAVIQSATAPANGVGCGLWTVSGSTITQVTDANYKSFNVQPGIAYLDQVYYVIEIGGKILGSGLGDPTTWPALDFVQADPEYGGGVTVCRHLNYLLAYYNFGMQVYYDANAAPNGQGIALNPVLSASFRVGCCSAFTVVEMADNNFWVAQDALYGRSVVMMTGLTMATISTPFIEKILNNPAIDWSIGIASKTWADGVKFGGHQFYVLTLSNLGFSLAFDLNTKQWAVWTSIVGGAETAFIGRHSFQDGFNGQSGNTWMLDTNTGYVIKVDPTVYTESTGWGIHVQAVTPNMDWGTLNWKRFGYMNQFADTVNTTVSVSYSDNDYQTFSTARTIDLNTVRKQLRNCGSSRRRAWKIEHTDNTPLRLYSMKATSTGLER